MQVFRLCREKYASTLSGKGASLKGGRWNSPGVELIYTSMNRSLAMAEVAVHFTLGTLPDDYMMVTIGIPDDLIIYELSELELPPDWNIFPHPSSTQRFGDKFVMSGQYSLMKVPSVVTQGDFNLLINPQHPGFKRIKIDRIEKFPFDRRIFRLR